MSDTNGKAPSNLASLAATEQALARHFLAIAELYNTVAQSEGVLDCARKLADSSALAAQRRILSYARELAGMTFGIKETMRSTMRELHRELEENVSDTVNADESLPEKSIRQQFRDLDNECQNDMSAFEEHRDDVPL